MPRASVRSADLFCMTRLSNLHCAQAVRMPMLISFKQGRLNFTLAGRGRAGFRQSRQSHSHRTSSLIQAFTTEEMA